MRALINKRKKGFILLFSMLVASIILAAGLGISRVIIKQIILASVQRDSQIAFFAADTGIECGRYWNNQGVFTGNAVNISCNGVSDIPVIPPEEAEEPYTFEFNIFTDPEQTEGAPDSFVRVEVYGEKIVARGYNTRESSGRQLDRALCFGFGTGGATACRAY